MQLFKLIEKPVKALTINVLIDDDNVSSLNLRLFKDSIHLK